MGTSSPRVTLSRLGVLLLLLVWAMPAVAYERPTMNRIAVSYAEEARPRTDGWSAIWYDAGTADRPAGLYQSRAEGPYPELIVEVSARFDPRHVSVANSYVVWSDYRDGSWNVYGTSWLSIGSEPRSVAATPADELFPAAGRLGLAWLSRMAGSSTLMAMENRHASKPVARALTVIPVGWAVAGVAMDAGLVVWHEVRGDGRWRLRSIAIDSTTAATLAEGAGALQGWDMLHGVLVYATAQHELRAKDLASGEEMTLAQHAVEPTTDSRYVIWTDVRDRASDGSTSLFGYDLLTDSRFAAVADGGAHGSPQLRNGLIVWSRDSGAAQAIYATRTETTLPSWRREAPDAASPDVSYFPETGHYLGLGFKSFWERSGGLSVFGYPLSEEFEQRNQDSGRFHTTQYFERQRFEYHPEHAGTPYEVLLGRLGAEELLAQGRDWRTLPKGDPQAPHYFAESEHAIAPRFWAYWRGHGLEFGDPGVSFRESLALFGYPLTEPQLETNPDGDTVLTQWFERARFEWHPDNPAPYQVLLGRLGAEVFADHQW